MDAESRLADFIVPRMSRSIFTTWGVLSMAAVDRERLQAPMNDTGVFFARDSGSIVVMATEECFNCVGNQFMVQDGGYVAADQAEVLLWDFTTQQEEQAIKIPEGQRPRDMLTMGDPWRVALQQVRSLPRCRRGARTCLPPFAAVWEVKDTQVPAGATACARVRVTVAPVWSLPPTRRL